MVVEAQGVLRAEPGVGGGSALRAWEPGLSLGRRWSCKGPQMGTISRKLKAETLAVQLVLKLEQEVGQGRVHNMFCSHLVGPLYLLTICHLASVSRYLAELCGVGTCGGESRAAFPTVSPAAPGRGVWLSEAPRLPCARIQPLSLLSPGGEAALLPLPGGPG